MHEKSNNDHWHAVEDPKKRKQIQDRLAQRARRKSFLPFHVPVSGADPNLVSHDTIELSTTACDQTESACSSSLLPFDLGDISFCNLDPTQVASPTAQPPYPLTVYGALYINGRMLGLSCSTTVPAKSSPVSSGIPVPLQPTPLQLLTIHARWIDRFPFPKMRNNMISMGGIIDDEEFLSDLFTIPSFSIKPGCATWDPHGWKIEKPFLEKWGYLFF
ncbi:uncharacterized protein BDR25DRAFT_211235 [Lindgomyces ingoldianus]|uniref:Uncharacterized protein n=1 Tax=Lindgomyces ingoldianus TaxID=673940 RepID=A0ACB6RBH5_9PLEO|nr:uncharacterized protein BDR25DRAFT_211235 [Lindgomyces ingoldianus]KAF2475687.1 hypothetical protein BDR25DRAFT_211235 [Lindgomyces ingoldianus]